MWTFRLRLHLTDGHDLDLFGAEATLERFRAGLARLMERGDGDLVSYLAPNQSTTVCVASIARIGDLDPVIPEALFAHRRRPFRLD